MAPRQNDHNKIELLQGTLDLLILQTLRREAQHGYAISQAIRARSGEILQVETGSLYPALHRMERQKWIASEWRTTNQNQRAKFYELTAEGRRQLAESRGKWQTMVSAIAGILNPQTEG